jgi:hypothetical protein
MKRFWSCAPPALVCLSSSFGMPNAQAQTSAELLKELRDLKARVQQLESRLQAREAAPAPPPTAEAPPGMTPEQARSLNRMTLKTEAIEDNLESAGLQGLKIGGAIDPVFIANRNQRSAGFQFLNGIPDGGFGYDNSFFGGVLLDLQKETQAGTQWRLTLAPNRGAGAGLDSPSIVHQATASVPLTDLQTRFIAGQMPDWSGYELLPATQNKLVTHNLLFDFTLPFAYTGAGIDLMRGKWNTKAMLANMNATRRGAGERTPVLAYRVDYARGEYQGFGFAGVHGRAANPRAANDFGANPLSGEPYARRDTALHLFEVDGYFIRGDWTLQGQASVGRQRHAAITADPQTGALRDARWWGLSGLAAYKLTPRLEGVVRADLLSNRRHGGGLLGYASADDRNGIGPDATLDCAATFSVEPRCGEGSRRTALSLGVNYVFNANTTFKAEYRLDHADRAVFLYTGDGSYRRTNQLLGASVVVAF